MTIAEAYVNLKLALPQGWTKEEVEEKLTDMFVEFERKAQEEQNITLEFEVAVGYTDADPFTTRKAQQLPTLMSQLQAAGNSVPAVIGKRYGNGF